jgi:hypothetical protein
VRPLSLPPPPFFSACCVKQSTQTLTFLNLSGSQMCFTFLF